MEKNQAHKLTKIVMTGGHAASTAFVVIEEIRKQKKPWEIFWIGFKSSFEGEKVSTLPSIYFPKYGIKTYDLISGRVQTKVSLNTIPSLLKIPVGFVHATLLLTKIRPNLILSFGGFSAFPVVVVGYILGIPVIIHEQTSVVGRANKFSAPFAKKIAISRETSREYFPPEKVVLTGNPVGRDIVKNAHTKSYPREPVIFITGGQSGSTSINSAVEGAINDLLKNARVVHQTGIKQEEKFKRIRDMLEPRLKERYEVYGMVDPKKYNEIFNLCAIVISRAGANTISNIVISDKRSILVPLPISYLDEQYKNALFAKDAVGARILMQENMTSRSLLAEVDYIVKNFDASRESGLKDNPDIDASERVVALIEENIK
jgi:UDP-N-acetylglucosamine--N-acetylmuramyl-(pentapeptide) pyrophosphoryl-undecaprenol N-acetylglucosamine transferase